MDLSPLAGTQVIAVDPYPSAATLLPYILYEISHAHWYRMACKDYCVHALVDLRFAPHGFAATTMLLSVLLYL
jgi:hypothetical protein